MEFYLKDSGNKLSPKISLNQVKILSLTRKWISRVEHVSDQFNSEHYEWKGGKGEKYNLKWRNDESGAMTVKAEQKVSIPIMNLISILYEDKYYTDWVRRRVLRLDSKLPDDGHEGRASEGHEDLPRDLQFSYDEEKGDVAPWPWVEQVPR